MDTLQCIQSRRTVRSYKKTKLGLDQIGMLLEAAKYAPSAGNLQNWRFVVVQNPEAKSRIADACVQQVWVEEAPAIIVVLSDLAVAGEYYGDRGKEVYSRHNAAAAAQNILLMAQSMGLASAWVGAFDEAMVGRVLGAPDSTRVEVVIPVGYAAEQVPIPPRYPLEANVFVESYGNAFTDMLEMLGYTSHKLKGGVTSAIDKLKEFVGK